MTTRQADHIFRIAIQDQCTAWLSRSRTESAALLQLLGPPETDPARRLDYAKALVRSLEAQKYLLGMIDCIGTDNPLEHPQFPAIESRTPRLAEAIRRLSRASRIPHQTAPASTCAFPAPLADPEGHPAATMR